MTKSRVPNIKSLQRTPKSGAAELERQELEDCIMRKIVSSGSPFEPQIGFSRAVRVGAFVAVSGTAPIAPGGGVAAPGDVYGQTRRCLEIIAQAVADAGLTLSSVVRTRVMLTDISRWQEAARARGVLLRHTSRLHIRGGEGPHQPGVAG
jgi:enamine deaminase RidA (YjgF/YER057c/UK114 family)